MSQAFCERASNHRFESAKLPVQREEGERTLINLWLVAENDKYCGKYLVPRLPPPTGNEYMKVGWSLISEVMRGPDCVYISHINTIIILYVFSET